MADNSCLGVHAFIRERSNAAGSSTCLTMNGGSGAGAFALGNVVVDKLSMTGNSTLNMILNPAVTFQVLRPQLLR